MLAYSSINHAGFILLGLEAADPRGVSASLYYLFAYTVMVIGTFAVVTVMARDGDNGHDLEDYRGLARRQPLLALALAVLLLAQAGAPFTTGFLAKLQVVSAVVAVHGYVLAAIAMLSAAIAVFFYLRLAVVMYSPTGAVADPVPAAAGGDGEEGGAGTGAVTELLTFDRGSDAVPGLAVLTGAPPLDDVAERRVAVPALTRAAILISVAVTVVFGIVPAPLVDFAHRATLLFH
jgi:NADH-quinone oxidoreductase subunit N